jgi:hypothetical protein
MHSIPGILLLVGGIVGALGVDGRIAWACVAIAGLFMVLPV